jgi:hypothetical protein
MSTFLSCAFREQEEGQIALPPYLFCYPSDANIPWFVLWSLSIALLLPVIPIEYQCKYLIILKYYFFFHENVHGKIHPLLSSRYGLSPTQRKSGR